MRKYLLLSLFVLFATSAIAFSADLRTVGGVVTKVVDGDTVHLITTEQTKLKVRLYGIDAQESYYKVEQPYGEAAKNALANKVMAKQVRLDIITTDKYRRIVGMLWLDDRNINLEMVREGHAEAFIEYLDEPYRKQFLDAEKEAKEAKKGIWSLPEYVRPIDFRKRMKVK